MLVGKVKQGNEGKSLFLLTVCPLMADGLGVGLKPFSYSDFRHDDYFFPTTVWFR